MECKICTVTAALKKLLCTGVAASVLSGVLPAVAFADTEYSNTAGTWKFDFGAGAAESGYIGVSADKRYADGCDYGFLGISEADSSFKQSMDMDNFEVIEGQVIQLYNETGSGAGANSDFVAAVQGVAAEGQPSDFYDYTTLNPIRFSMKVENGGYYHVKVTLANSSSTESAKLSLFTERRHQLLTDEVLAAGATLDYEFNVDVETFYEKTSSTGAGSKVADDSISIIVTGKNAAIAAMEVTKLQTGTTLWLMGDSTSCDQTCAIPYFPHQSFGGVGQGLTKYLPADIALSNHADNGINSANNVHYNNVKLKAGDYFYAEWGHNETSTQDYKTNLEKYYRDSVKAGANLIVAGPIDRSTESQFDADTGKWSSTLSDYSAAGKEFVEAVLSNNTDNDFVKGILGDDYSSYTADQLNNIAFVDLNEGWIKFLDAATERYKTVMGAQDYEYTSVKTYYKANKPGYVESSHENDAGADNAAYIFFTEAKQLVEAGNADNASASEQAQAQVLRGLTENMRNNTPYTTPEVILTGGNVKKNDVSNSYYPEAVEATYSGDPAEITGVTVRDGSLESVTIEMKYVTALRNKDIEYALAVAEVGGIEYKSSMNSKYDQSDGNGSFTLVFDTPVNLGGGEYSVWLQGLDGTSSELKTGDDYRFSGIYTGCAYLNQLYSEDFEGAQHKFTAMLATTEYWGADNATKNINTTKIYASKKKAGGAYWILDNAVGGNIRAEMDFRIDGQGSTKDSYIALLSSDNETSSFTTENALIYLKAHTDNTSGLISSFSVNETDDITSAAVLKWDGKNIVEECGNNNETTPVRRDTTGWLKLTADMDFAEHTADITLKRISDGSEVYSGTVSMPSSAEGLKEVYFVNGGGYGGVYIDNVVISEDIRKKVTYSDDKPAEIFIQEGNEDEIGFYGEASEIGANAELGFIVSGLSESEVLFTFSDEARANIIAAKRNGENYKFAGIFNGLKAFGKSPYDENITVQYNQ
ncbi:MAG: hypothetical protein ACI4TH_10175 [Candidatus Ornithomonoglobus sp.]